MAAYHKVDRVYLGVGNPIIHKLARGARKGVAAGDLAVMAGDLWETDIHEARVAAASLFSLKTIRGDGPVWDLLCGWVEDFDAWAIADHASGAVMHRLVAEPERLDVVEGWLDQGNGWVRRAAMVSTLHWARIKAPGAEDLARRERILGWAARIVPDQEWFAQKCVAWWLRELSRRDEGRVLEFMDAHGESMKPFARREAVRLI